MMTDKTWLITGASAGLGRELVTAALARGDRVVATSRNPQQLDDLVRAHADRMLAVALDVTDPDDARSVAAAAVDRFGSLDVVVNNAGYAASAAIEDIPLPEFRTQLEINLFGVINVTKAVLPIMRQHRTGHIIQISSIGGRVGGTPGLSPYQTAKFGVEGFSEVLANEVAPLGIKVIIVEPGGLRTSWAAGAAEAPVPVTADYEQTVGEWVRRFAAYTGNEPGDPAKAAEAIAEIIDQDRPPRRLLLGSDALDIALQSGIQRNAEAESWAEVSRSVDFPSE